MFQKSNRTAGSKDRRCIKNWHHHHRWKSKPIKSWGIYNVQFLWGIWVGEKTSSRPDKFPPDNFLGGQVPGGGATFPQTKSLGNKFPNVLKKTSSMTWKMSGGKLSRRNLSASRRDNPESVRIIQKLNILATSSAISPLLVTGFGKFGLITCSSAGDLTATIPAERLMEESKPAQLFIYIMYS